MVVVKYTKCNEGMFFSHFNIIRIWKRIFAISGVEVESKNQDNSTLKMYFSLPTRVNVESEAEYVVIETPLPSKEVEDKIENNLPKWMELVYVSETTNQKLSISSINNCARYEILFDDYKTLKGRIKEFFELPEIMIEIELHGEKKKVNVKDRIFKYELKDDCLVVYAGVNEASVRIDELVKVLLANIGRKDEYVDILKTGLFVYDQNGKFVDIDEIIRTK